MIRTLLQPLQLLLPPQQKILYETLHSNKRHLCLADVSRQPLAMVISEDVLTGNCSS